MECTLPISRSQSATHSSWPKLRDKTTQCNGMLNSSQGPLAALILACRPGLVSHLAGVINTSIEARYSNAAPNASLLLRRSLQVLNAVLKEFAGFKMLTGVKTMGKVRPRTSLYSGTLADRSVACGRAETTTTEPLCSALSRTTDHQSIDPEPSPHR